MKIIKVKPAIWFRILLLMAVGLSACQSPAAKKDGFAGCAYTPPEPIFSADLPGVKSHDFHLDTQESTEQVKFGDGVNLSIRQSGCDHRKQEFKFQIPGAYSTKNNGFWVREAVQQLRGLSELGPEYVVFEHWSESIARAAKNIQLSETAEVEEGFFVSVDRVLASDHATLMLTLSDQP